MQDKRMIIKKLPFFVSTETFSHPVTVYNSKGSTSTLILHFAKLENNKWAVELAAQADENGIFNIDGLAAPNGLVKYGTISFNQDGTLNVGSIEGFNGAVTINWTDGSEPSSITIDFPNELSEIKTGNVISLAKAAKGRFNRNLKSKKD